VRKKQNEPWLLFLFACVAVVNLGYTLIAFSNTVECALFANKITYLGQVLIPLCMFMLISKLCGYTYKKWVLGVLIGAAVIMFAIICTTGYLDWYYTSATIEKVDGATVLHKEYGVLHPINLIYVILYFVGMITVIGLSLGKHKSASQKHACGMLLIVLGNIAMWCFGKVIPWDVEFLSVTYLMSAGGFLIEWLMLQDYVLKNEVPSPVIVEEKAPIIIVDNMTRAEKIKTILASLPEDTVLSTRQMDILERILDYKSRKEIAVELHLSENTVKTHTGMLYKALGVSGRDEIYAMFQK
jgi:DNA-binding CsgD family transcriptional regulator